MGIFSRTRDIIAANFSDLLDRSEDPARMIRQIIFEMNETLVEVRSSAARAIADQKEMRRHIAKLDALQTDWKEKAELALSKNREDLATAALIEKRKASDMADRLRTEVAQLDEVLGGYEADIAKLQQKLSDARSRQSHIANRMESAENLYRMREMTNGDRVEDAFSRFEELERRVDAAQGRADAMSMGRGKSLEEELAELQAAERVADELAELKAAQNHSQTGTGE
ncbi:phage shock protein PspA [Sphingopyxis yananensis]|uniref:phage shock protein PspA n=1 Tax=Sphingopyxis yananensis TaxID=2886687 RepID=UPI001D0F6D20|nr:phage shock protein PspA [Sphingopyxis yananensis]MCC2602913.1 phage shock protein PspA [Sphingopyxis yananensis]